MGGADQELLLQINQHAGPLADRVMVLASSMAFWTPFLILLGVAAFFLGGFRARAMLLCLGLSVGVVDGIIVNSVKDMVGRPRPYQVIDGLRTPELADTRPRQLAAFQALEIKESRAEIGPIQGRSFPSGHTANNFAAAMVLALFYRRWGWTYFLIAGLVGYSRIYLGVHWPSDVLTSAFMGSGVALLIVASAEAIWQRWGLRLIPGLALRHPSLLVT